MSPERFHQMVSKFVTKCCQDDGTPEPQGVGLSESRNIRLTGAAQVHHILTWAQAEQEDGAEFERGLTLNLHCEKAAMMVKGEITSGWPGYLVVTDANTEFDLPIEGFERGLETFIAITDNNWERVEITVSGPAQDIQRLVA